MNSQPKRSLQQIEKLRSVFSALSSSVVFVPSRGEGGERENFQGKRKPWTKILLVVNVGSHKKRSNQLNKLKKDEKSKDCCKADDNVYFSAEIMFKTVINTYCHQACSSLWTVHFPVAEFTKKANLRNMPL